VSEPLKLWLWTITDEITKKRRQTRYRMTEAEARERFGDDAVKVEGSLEVAARWEPAHELVSASVNLGPCPACGKAEGEQKKSEFGSRFPHYLKCKACGFMTALVTLPAVAAKLWNEAKKPAKAKKR
jgi:hypothetical protein